MVRKYPLFLILCLIFPFLTCADNDPLVTLKQGKLRGVIGRNIDGGQFYQFFGIPYAKPPLRELRFEPPQPAGPWTGVRDGSKIGDTCISMDTFSVNTVGSEDCLYLNVYTRQLPNKKAPLKPVMVFIYGGGLTFGSSDPKVYGPEFLMLKDIVLVTFNYRLGVLGFLSFDDPTLGVPGNMGLKDQNLALKWVQDNIKSFSGNPNDVTIFGNSAGASSVHAHILSTASKGLFHKAILQSGTVLHSWFWGSKNNAVEVVNKAGRVADSQKAALEILKNNMSAAEIFAAQQLVTDSPYPADRRPFSAVIEVPNDTGFLTKNPVEIIKGGRYNRVPMMMGYNQDEGMLLDIEYIAENKTSLHIPQWDLKQFIPFNLNVPKGSRDYEDILDKLKKLYANPTIDSRYDPVTDSNILAALLETLRLHKETSSNDIYLYRMSLSGELNQFKCLLNITNEPGVAHSDELGYLFKTEITPPITPGGAEDKSLRTFVELWTNFAIQGNPNSRRLGLHEILTPTGHEDDLEVIDIGRNVCMKNLPERNRMKVWGRILKKWPWVKFLKFLYL